MADRIREYIAERHGKASDVAAQFDQELKGPADEARYQAAFSFLEGVGGADACNRVIRRAILEAVPSSDPKWADDLEMLKKLEGDKKLSSDERDKKLSFDEGDEELSFDERDKKLSSDEGDEKLSFDEGKHQFRLTPAVKALGDILQFFAEKRTDSNPVRVVTTNFDPLIEVAIRRAGGRTVSKSWQGGHVWSADRECADETSIVEVHHVHGLWLHDTWHTPASLTSPRPRLVEELTRIFRGHTVVVLAYGGWQDMIMHTLTQVVESPTEQPEIAWCFYERRPTVARLFTKFDPLGPRATYYVGVDAHDALPRLRARLHNEGGVLGRRALCDDLIKRLTHGPSPSPGEDVRSQQDDGDAVGDGDVDFTPIIQLVGPSCMRRSELLQWLATEGRRRGKKVVHIKAGALARPTPEALVPAIAEQMGMVSDIERTLYEKRAMPKMEDAVRCVEQLRNAWVLVDDAGRLFSMGWEKNAEWRDGHLKDSKPLFDALAKQCNDRDSQLRWVSVSDKPLDAPFPESHQVLLVGALDREEVERALTVRLGKERGGEALEAAGTLPRLVYHLCDAEFDPPEVIKDKIQRLGEWARHQFDMWWGELGDDEKKVLKNRSHGHGDKPSEDDPTRRL